MKIEITEEQAEIIRLGLQCYRNTCVVPASFGSSDFAKVAAEIQETLDWFDNEVAHAKQDKTLDDVAREAAEDFENAKERFRVAWGQLVQWWNDNSGLKALAAQLAALQEPEAPEQTTEAEKPVDSLCVVCGRETRLIHTAAGKVLLHTHSLPEDRHTPMTIDYEEMNKP